MNKIDWDKIYESRGLFSGYGSRGGSAELKVDSIRKVIQRFKPQSILDVGCGDMHVINQINLDGSKYAGLDSSSIAIEAARTK